ncbi:MAG: SRPBCC domain-containing protein [Halapricum sp.]
MQSIETTIDIDASPAAVWAVLTDFAAYPEWNPFVQRIDGSPTDGNRLSVRIQPPEGRGMTFKPRITAVDPERRLEWLGRLFVRGLFDGRHTFELSPLPSGGTQFTQRETFSGLLVGMLLDEADIREGFDAMNVALKDRIEGSERSEPAATVTA